MYVAVVVCGWKGQPMASKRKRDSRGHGESKEKVISSSSSSSYSDPTYWENRHDLIHEWYYSYSQIQPLVHQTFSTLPPSLSHDNEKITFLEIGCGNAPLIHSMRDDPMLHGNHFIGIDFSSSIIQTLKNSILPSSSLHLEYEVMDARSLKYSNETMSYLIDKGTMDAMLCSKQWKKNIKLIFSEMCRVLKCHGFIMIISHLAYESNEFQEILQEIWMPILTESFHRMWSIEIHCGEKTDDEGSDEDEGDGEKVSRKDPEEGKEEKDNGEGNNATVYIIKSSPRRITRSLQSKVSRSVNIKVSTYEIESSEGAQS
jgi:EEF1A lysine methyltransferase 4